MDSTQTDQLVCEWGGEHRETGKSTCAICEIPKNLNEAIQWFLYYEEALEFGRMGSMAYRLRDVAIRQYSNTIVLFRKYQAVSEEHPEWHLAQEILRLRTRFDEVTEDCAKEIGAFARADPYVDHVLPQKIGHDEKALRDAISSVYLCFETCCDIIEGHVEACDPPILETEYPDSYLPDIDATLRKAVDAIKLLSENENAAARDLTNKAHKMYKEARRVLCEFVSEQKPSTGTYLRDQAYKTENMARKPLLSRESVAAEGNWKMIPGISQTVTFLKGVELRTNDKRGVRCFMPELRAMAKLVNLGARPAPIACSMYRMLLAARIWRLLIMRQRAWHQGALVHVNQALLLSMNSGSANESVVVNDKDVAKERYFRQGAEDDMIDG